MANFTIRVELAGEPSEEIYDKLHSAMKGLGFVRTVDGVDSNNEPNNFDLPTGLYFGNSANSAIDTREAVRKVAGAIHQVRAIFVAQTETWASWGPSRPR